jgi:peptidoglycan/xylan/chitin deacetylase (PgdA/CDA1 family)/glycosyltransferase involved in cell wall biosynthesis
LDSLASQTESDFEVIVVCDGEDEQTRLLAQRSEPRFSLTWVFNKNHMGLAAARNVGASGASGDIILFLDDDTSAAPDWLFHHRKHHEKNNLASPLVVCGRIVNTYVEKPPSGTERFLRRQNEESLKHFANGAGAAAVLRVSRDSHLYRYFGLNSSIKRDMFLKSGGFDPQLMVDEEMEFGSRLFDHDDSLLVETNSVVKHRDTKQLHDYWTRCWQASGHNHLYRVLTKQQRNAQTKGMAAPGRRTSLRKAKAWVSFNFHEQIEQMANVVRQTAEATESDSLFHLWLNLSMSAKYWGGMRSAGFTWKSLRDVAGSPLPVFSFHSICAPRERKERRYYLSPDRFRGFIKILKTLGYSSVRPEQGLFAQVPHRRVVLTFDDGYDDFYHAVFPYVSTFPLKPVVFVVVDQIGKWNVWDAKLKYKFPRRLLTIEQVREMQKHGVLFGSHTLTHPFLPALPDLELRREVQDSKARLEDLLGSEVAYFAYPYGGIDLRVRAAVGEAGYRLAFSVEHGSNLWQDPLALRRIELSDRDSYASMLLKLLTDRSIEHDILLPLAAAMRRGARHLPPQFDRLLKSIQTHGFLP